MCVCACVCACVCLCVIMIYIYNHLIYYSLSILLFNKFGLNKSKLNMLTVF